MNLPTLNFSLIFVQNNLYFIINILSFTYINIITWLINKPFSSNFKQHGKRQNSMISKKQTLMKPKLDFLQQEDLMLISHISKGGTNHIIRKVSKGSNKNNKSREWAFISYLPKTNSISRPQSPKGAKVKNKRAGILRQWLWWDLLFQGWA